MSVATVCRAPLPWETLVRYWLGELDDAGTEQVDRHLLGCDACGGQLDEIVALGNGVRRAFDAGLVAAVIDDAFAQRLAARGLRVRTHRVERGGSVNCGVAPDDEVVISRLAGAPLEGVARLDIVRRGKAGAPDARAVDIPFDAARGEIVLVMSVARLRALPDGVEQVQLLAVDASGGERDVGRYTFNHRAAR